MALDGVGPSMARGSHPEKGTCAAFPAAASSRSRRRQRVPALPVSWGTPSANEAVPAQWCMANTPTSNPMSQARYTAKTRRPFSTGAGALLEESDQQYRSDAHDLPAAYQQVERTGSKCEQGSEREQVQQQKEPQETALAMQVGGRELADESGKHNRHAQEWQRQPVCHQHQREVVIMHRKPVAESHH